VRLNLLHLFGREPRNSEPVIEAAPIQAVEQRKIRALCGNDHFAAEFMLEPSPRQNPTIERLPSRANVTFRLPGL